MRRFLTLVCLLCVAIPAGISISGCTRNPAGNYCNGLGYGLKDTDVDSITLLPLTSGISIAFGQTLQVALPTAKTCKGTAATVGTYTYGTTNNQLVDISPTGNICAGTWNRNTGGGIANYTICSFPNPLPSTGGLPYATAYVTASVNSVTSNPVEVYVHAQVTSVTLATLAVTGSGQQCFSQGTQAILDAQACYSNGIQQFVLCAPSSVTSNYACAGGLPPGATSVPDCTSAIGTLGYVVGTPGIASIVTNTTTNQVSITADQPGTTVITASVAGGSSSAGYFSTCPPKSINVTLANGKTVGTVTQGVTQNLTTTVLDTNDNPITGLSLAYQSTDPIDIAATSGGSITTNFPGIASVYAICQPAACNPAPINEVGLYGTGLSISSNPVKITTPGTASDFVWFGAPGQSQYFVPVELLSGTVGSTVRLPYVPNSMMMDRLGSILYFGSSHELMEFIPSTDTLVKADPTVPGVVLAVSPNDQTLLINDQVRQIFYIYSVNGGVTATFGGMGSTAAWTPDSQTLYITDSAALNNTPENIAAGITGHTDTLYVYNLNNWTTYPLAASGPSTQNPGAENLAITIPGVGAFLSGNPTVAHTWCPSGTVGDSASMIFYPQGPEDSVDVTTDVLAATTDGAHILGAAYNATNGVTLSDIGVTIPTTVCPGVGVEAPLIGGTLSALSTSPTLSALLNVSKVSATAVNQVVASPESNLAFLTYTASSTNSNALLPYYVPGSGVVNYVTLNGSSAITAPIAGAFSPDDTLFFVSTAGDNLIHYISIPSVISTTTPLKDTQQIAPNLPACTPGADPDCTLTTPTAKPVPATVIVVKPRSTT